MHPTCYSLESHAHRQWLATPLNSQTVQVLIQIYRRNTVKDCVQSLNTFLDNASFSVMTDSKPYYVTIHLHTIMLLTIHCPISQKKEDVEHNTIINTYQHIMNQPHFKTFEAEGQPLEERDAKTPETSCIFIYKSQ